MKIVLEYEGLWELFNNYYNKSPCDITVSVFMSGLIMKGSEFAGSVLAGLPFSIALENILHLIDDVKFSGDFCISIENIISVWSLRDSVVYFVSLEPSIEEIAPVGSVIKDFQCLLESLKDDPDAYESTELMLHIIEISQSK